MLSELPCVITLPKIDEILARRWFACWIAHAETREKMRKSFGKNPVVEENMSIKAVIGRGFKPQLNAGKYSLVCYTRMALEVTAHSQVAFEGPIVHDAKGVDVERVDLINYGLAGGFAFSRSLLI